MEGTHSSWLASAAVVATSLGVLAFLFRPRMRRNTLWQATVTPLASIIGSGFLIVAPIMAFSVGTWAVAAVAGIVALAYAVGGAMRYNIAHVEAVIERAGAGERRARVLQTLEQLARSSLALAYLIAVTFYLELLSAFSLRPFDAGHPLLQPGIASGVLLLIGGYGCWRGLTGLEFLEKYAVDTKLVVIGGLLAGLLFMNGSELLAGTWQLPALPADWSVDTLRRLLGAFLIVQGFETSRYLGGAYSAAVRIRSMRYAQWTAAAIYITFVGLATILLDSFAAGSETAIIDLSQHVAQVLPPLLVIAAIMSQFSAAIADTISSGGLVEEASHGRIGRRIVYAAMTLAALVLLWSTDIFVIVAWASRAFALYYGIQCAIAAIHSQAAGSRLRHAQSAGFVALALAMLAIAVFAIPVERAAPG